MKKYKDFIISISIVMLTQATVYFLIKSFVNNYNLMTSFVQVPYISHFVYFYDSWYPFILLSAFIIYKHDKKTYLTLIITMMITALAAHITFLIYPSMIERPEITVKNLSDWAVYMTYKTDTPVNCLPSVHCLYCFVMSYYVIVCKNLKTKFKVLMVIYALLIAVSTLFIVQHIAEDAILALVYAIILIPVAHLIKNKIKYFKIFKSFN